jgi:hypothetical protein
LGAIIRHGGRTGTIVCVPSDLDCLLHRPSLLSYDPMGCNHRCRRVAEGQSIRRADDHLTKPSENVPP